MKGQIQNWPQKTDFLARKKLAKKFNQKAIFNCHENQKDSNFRKMAVSHHSLFTVFPGKHRLCEWTERESITTQTMKM